jgi:hypothetical protein
MTKNTTFKSHSLDGNQKNVFRGWKASTSSDYDFQNTDLTGEPKAFIKLIQEGLAETNPTCEVVVCLKLQFRGLNNQTTVANETIPNP